MLIYICDCDALSTGLFSQCTTEDVQKNGWMNISTHVPSVRPPSLQGGRRELLLANQRGRLCWLQRLKKPVSTMVLPIMMGRGKERGKAALFCCPSKPSQWEGQSTTLTAIDTYTANHSPPALWIIHYISQINYMQQHDQLLPANSAHFSNHKIHVLYTYIAECFQYNSLQCDINYFPMYASMYAYNCACSRMHSKLKVIVTDNIL